MYALDDLDSRYLHIQEIKADETFEVRHPVLRPGRPLETCAMPGDHDTDTFHLGLFYKQKLIGVVSLMKNAKPQFEGAQFQLRGMAVLEDYQGLRLGNILVDEAERRLRANKIELLWCNARIKALNFYQRKAFEIHGEPFEIEPIGTHYLLAKKL